MMVHAMLFWHFSFVENLLKRDRAPVCTLHIHIHIHIINKTLISWMLQMNTRNNNSSSNKTNKHDMQNLINILWEFCLLCCCCCKNGDNSVSKGNSVDGKSSIRNGNCIHGILFPFRSTSIRSFFTITAALLASAKHSFRKYVYIYPKKFFFFTQTSYMYILQDFQSRLNIVWSRETFFLFNTSAYSWHLNTHSNFIHTNSTRICVHHFHFHWLYFCTRIARIRSFVQSL